MTPKVQTEIKLLCYATVSHMFATMHNPKMRGPKFTWEGFPEMMANHCKTMVLVNITCPKKQQAECEQHAYNTGREIAENLVRWMQEE